MDYRIPWAPLDITKGIDSLLEGRKENRDSARADEYLKIQKANTAIATARESAEEYRRKRDFEAKQAELARAHDIEARAAFPSIAAAARKSMGMGNFMGSPYGIKFEDD